MHINANFLHPYITTIMWQCDLAISTYLTYQALLSWYFMLNVDSWCFPRFTVEFQGTLPDSWSQMSQLFGLSLHRGGVNGTLPAAWGNMTQLRVLYLNNSNLTGTLPESWGQLKRLKTLVLQANQLTGQLPKSWAYLPKLITLELSHNNFSGPIPDSWAHAWGFRHCKRWICHSTACLLGACQPNGTLRCLPYIACKLLSHISAVLWLALVPLSALHSGS